MKSKPMPLTVLFAVFIAGLVVAVSLVLENSYNVPNATVLLLGGSGLAALVTLVFAVLSSSKAATSPVDNFRENTLVSPPLILQKPIYSTISLDQFGSGYFSHFLVINAGDAPTIELACTVSRDKKTPLLADRVTFLRSGEEKRVVFNLAGLEKGQYYFITDYLMVSPANGLGSYTRTCLPFEVNKSGHNLVVTTSEITFDFNLSERDRVIVQSEKTPIFNRPAESPVEVG
jgi:hypothetical protein